MTPHGPFSRRDSRQLRTFNRKNCRVDNRERSDSEAGAILILALIFLVAISFAILSLSNWTESSLNNSLKFQNTSERLYAAEGVTQLAVRASRYTFLNGVPGANESGYICPGTLSPILINDIYVQDWCSTQTFQFGTITREISITACLMPSASTTLVGADCDIGSVNVPNLLSAVISIDDISSSHRTNQCAFSNESACGASMTIVSWRAT